MTKILILSFGLLMFISFSSGEIIDIKKCKAQKFIVTGYYSPLKSQSFYYKGNFSDEKILNGQGIRGASGIAVFNGMIAAPKTYSFGTIVYFPGYGVGKVTDRGGAIVKSGLRGNNYDRIDIWMGYGEEGLKRAISFGKKELQAYICTNVNEIGFDFDKFLIYQNFFDVSIWSMSLEPGRNDMWVKSLQKYLYKLGYLTDNELTGYYGSKTKSAVCRYQQKYKLAASTEWLCGYFGPKTRSHLKQMLLARGLLQSKLYSYASSSNGIGSIQLTKSIFSKGFLLGEKHSQIKVLQEKLILLGYYNGKINGQFDKTTAEAVYKFQLKNNIIKGDKDQIAQGYFGPQTRKQLILELEKFELEKQKIAKEEETKEITIKKVKQAEQIKETKNNLSIFTRGYKKGENSPDIKILQEKLIMLGYYKGKVSGEYDQSTSNAVFDFQLNNNILTKNDDIALRGYFGPSTRKLFEEKLKEYIIEKERIKEQERKESLAQSQKYKFNRGFVLGEEGEEIGLLQEKLLILGYLEGEITNKYDKTTAEAIYKFQLKNNILKGDANHPAQGYFGPQTRKVFNNYISQQANNSIITSG